MTVVVVSREEVAPLAREALLLAATEALNFAVGLTSAAASDAAAAPAAAASAVSAAPAAAASAVLASGVQRCPRVDLQVR